MARSMVHGEGGFPYNRTDVQGNILIGKSGCIDTIAYTDVDGDGYVDLIAIESAGGHSEDDDHELVAVHMPSGAVVWRALNGEVSKHVAVVDGVLLASTDDCGTLRALDPRTGREGWRVQLPDKLSDDICDTQSNAPSIGDLGKFAVFECVDGTVHAVEAHTGRIVASRRGHLLPHGDLIPGLFAIKTEGEDGDDAVELIDLFRNRTIYSDRYLYRPVLAPGEGAFALFHGGYAPPHGAAMTKAVLFDGASFDLCAQTWVRGPGDEGVLPHNTLEHDRHPGFLLPGNRLLVGDRDSATLSVIALGAPPAPAPAQAQAKGGFFSKMFGGGGGGGGGGGTGGAVQASQRIPPPRPGHVFRGFVRAGSVVAAAYEKDEGTKKLLVVGYDVQTLQPRWQVEAGGTHLETAMLSNGFAILVPYAKRDDRSFAQNNPTALWHIDPETGQKLTEYPVPSLETVSLQGYYLHAFVDTYYHGFPVMYDTWGRRRLL